MSKNKLILTVGLPLSGKSTWAKKQNLPIVCPDAIRIALHGERFKSDAEPMVWVIAKYMVKSLFLAGHNHIILDATNTTLKARHNWNDDKWECYYKIIKTEKEVCAKRAIKNEDTIILPVIERMANQYEPLNQNELRWQDIK